MQLVSIPNAFSVGEEEAEQDHAFSQWIGLGSSILEL